MNTLALVDIQRLVGGPTGQGQERALWLLIRQGQGRLCGELHPDNGGNILNIHLYVCPENGIEMSRPRPYKKNDNRFIERKLHHVRHLRLTLRMSG